MRKRYEGLISEISLMVADGRIEDKSEGRLLLNDTLRALSRLNQIIVRQGSRW
jgi:hypothetical protein